jgi:NAD(P)-dependent dehydrogenase (short-subunit alcohol dehydrogenase family)
MGKLHDKIAIVTGAGQGIGRGIAEKLAAEGATVVVTDINEATAQETADALGAAAIGLHTDVTSRESVDAMVAQVREQFARIDVLVNNAGYGSSTPFLDLELEEWQGVIDVNLTGAFLAAQAAARRMVRQGRGGAIVNVTSVHEHIPLSGSGPYTASKHGLGGLTKVMALELGQHRIRVNSVAPGQIATRMTGQEDRPPAAANVPLSRAGDAREVGSLIAWLASDEASYVTGSSYVIDGGLMLTAAEQQ